MPPGPYSLELPYAVPRPRLDISSTYFLWADGASGKAGAIQFQEHAAAVGDGLAHRGQLKSAAGSALSRSRSVRGDSVRPRPVTRRSGRRWMARPLPRALSKGDQERPRHTMAYQHVTRICVSPICQHNLSFKHADTGVIVLTRRTSPARHGQPPNRRTGTDRGL